VHKRPSDIESFSNQLLWQKGGREGRLQLCHGHWWRAVICDGGAGSREWRNLCMCVCVCECVCMCELMPAINIS